MYKRRYRAFDFTILWTTICFVFLFALPSYADILDEDETKFPEEINVEESVEFGPSSEAHVEIGFNIFEDIARARGLLGEQRCGFKLAKTKRLKVKKVLRGKKLVRLLRGNGGQRPELGGFTILIAIENVKTREIKIVRVHPRLGGKSGGIVIEPGKSNGVNTKFNIIYSEQYIVLAVKRPVRSGTGFKEVVYTPYSEDLDVPVVRKAGFDYLKNVIGAAKNDLLKRGVQPLSGDMFVDDEVAFVLAIIEHIDPQKFENGNYTMERLIHETLVIMGTNTHNAYRYSVSKAGARGLFQFIPKTYKRMVAMYPRAGLKKDFIQGMEDHENAAKASFLLFDSDICVLGNERVKNVKAGGDTLGRFLASAYNCGSGRTRIAMDRYGYDWHLGLPAETQTYLKKFDVVWEWLSRETY
ncbi:MAG: transglycosylase SLT domain-containing protein [Syntrophobacterales bacterium]|jgi:hypothetical protein|nr:transglycosylase SLT domain-containing protein [Syntrophobacterales bacterium]